MLQYTKQQFGVIMGKCTWAHGEPIENYHDLEHGKLPSNNRDLFELLVLEIFQPGLSFNIVLKKRVGLRKFFKNYDIEAISAMTEEDILLGLDNDEIIKHRLKISSVIANAKLIVNNSIDLQSYLFDNIDYRFGTKEVGKLLSKQMKKDGFKFVGPSVATSLLEAIGLLTGHSDECEYQPIMKNEFSYQTKFGAIHIKYDNFKIISSSLLHNSICLGYVPINSFEHFLIYHLDNYQYNNVWNFKLLLDLNGTEFQCRVWDAILQVPYGQTRTYGDIAYTIGTGAFRAVGGAVAKCNFAIFIPAWRIVSSTGIGGFQNQVELKRELLLHEGISTYS